MANTQPYKERYEYSEIMEEARKEYGITHLKAHTYRRLVRQINKEMSRLLYEEDMVIEFPHALGFFFINRVKGDLDKPKKNYKLSKLYGKDVFFLNEHTGGDYFRHYWRKGSADNSTYYAFKVRRDLKRSLYAHTMKGMQYTEKQYGDFKLQ